ncbi:hypothetical protein O3G_MSEX014596 [Manduca sexta]|uniref:Uncharacterized protein n=1 Tax=Manduca sexta TaxID=7130 RepID=A0A922CZU1_MANSE|nr:hypothetical protein O3G_MSEX014597 [Manduca sexta]KAG6464557.1 hypothetical protein O3G_MSEX014596 [Manduca sexta]
MRSLWLTLTLALTLTWTRTSALCPKACQCGSGDELEYSCKLAGGKVTITATLRDNFNIDCEVRVLTLLWTETKSTEGY